MRKANRALVRNTSELFYTFNSSVFSEKKLERIQTSEAAVERIFSHHKLVHSQIRASLKDDIVEKILLRFAEGVPSLAILGQGK